MKIISILKREHTRGGLNDRELCMKREESNVFSFFCNINCEFGILKGMKGKEEIRRRKKEREEERKDFLILMHHHFFFPFLAQCTKHLSIAEERGNRTPEAGSDSCVLFTAYRKCQVCCSRSGLPAFIPPKTSSSEVFLLSPELCYQPCLSPLQLGRLLQYWRGWSIVAPIIASPPINVTLSTTEGKCHPPPGTELRCSVLMETTWEDYHRPRTRSTQKEPCLSMSCKPNCSSPTLCMSAC